MKTLPLLLGLALSISMAHADNIIRTSAPILFSSTPANPGGENPVDPGEGGSETPAFSLQALTLPQAKVGKPYDYSLRTLLQWQSAPDSRSLSWSSTALQDGLGIAGEKISGTPTVGGSQLIDLKGSLDGISASGNYVLNIMDVNLTPLDSQNIMAGKTYSLNLANQAQWVGLASGQTAPTLSWKVTSGSSLPSGLSLASSGELTGMPSTEGSYTVRVESSNTDFSKTMDVPFQIDVNSISSTKIAAGSSNTCAITTNKTVKCWGYQGYNGDGTNTTRPTPVDVLNITDAVSLTYGYNHGCAITGSGNLYCWGGNGYRQIGSGDSTTALAPYLHTAIGAVKSVDAAQTHTCASNAAGEMYCWGYNAEGRTGLGVSSGYTAVPTKLNIPEAVVQVAVSSNNSYALTASGKIYGMGNFVSASITMLPGYSSDQLSPVLLSSLGSDNIKIEGDNYDTRACVLKSNKSLYCMGSSPGNGASNSGSGVVSVLTNVADIEMGGGTSCAILSDRSIRCWGDNSNSKHNSTSSTNNWSPRLPDSPSNLANVASISPGTAHACNVSFAGTTRCWGNGSNYRLGLGNTTNVTTPTPIP
jgi:alpha-tubulin suppressor-like RCC1 family protein